MATHPLTVRLGGTDIELTVVDVSTGGFRGRGTRPVPTNRCYLCAFEAEGVGLIRIQATALYCWQSSGDNPVFDVGFAFLHPSHAMTQATAGTLLEHVTSVLEIDHQIH